jgi:putative membrane protein
LERVKLNVELGFDEHLFAKINAVINSTVSFFIGRLIAVKAKDNLLHKRIMITAIILSSLFLSVISAIIYLQKETKFGGEQELSANVYYLL